MEATAIGLLHLLSKLERIEIPLFQRHYSWTVKECEQLWTDVLETGRLRSTSNGEAVHFVGSIVYLPDKTLATRRSYLVIDGQQRLTTTSLMLQALFCRAIEIDGEAAQIDNQSITKLRHKYLVETPGSVNERGRILLTEVNQQTMSEILLSMNHDAINSTARGCDEDLLWDNYCMFMEKMNNISSMNVLDEIFDGLQGLRVIEMVLEGGMDEAQLIFASLNSKGMVLTQADLIRNYMLMVDDRYTREMLFRKYWRVMEEHFGDARYREYFASFIRHFLTMELGRILREDRVYEEFISYVKDCIEKNQDKEAILKRLMCFGNHYCRMAFNTERDVSLSAAFGDIKRLGVDVAFPLLLAVYDVFQRGELSSAELARIVNMVESYVFRRAVCGRSASGYNTMFSRLAEQVKRAYQKEGVSGESLVVYVETKLLDLRGASVFPNDSVFAEALCVKDMKRLRKRRDYLLLKLENFRKEGGRGPGVDLTLEHVMPQTPRKGELKYIGGEENHEMYLNRLGNLTLTRDNSRLGNKPFRAKKEILAKSDLRINKYFSSVGDVWGPDEIMARSEKLSRDALVVWPYPRPDQTIRSFKSSVAGEDHEVDGSTGYAFKESQGNERRRESAGNGECELERRGKVDTVMDPLPHVLLYAADASLFYSLEHALSRLDGFIETKYGKRHIRIQFKGLHMQINVQKRHLLLRLFVDEPVLHDPENMWKRFFAKDATKKCEYRMRYDCATELDCVTDSIQRLLIE